MKVLRGASAEIGNNKWAKFDTELDEQDLNDLIITHNLTSSLSLNQKFQLLRKQAEFFVTVEMESQGLRGSRTSAQLQANLTEYISSLPKAE